jgi:hypothetical protein
MRAVRAYDLDATADTDLLASDRTPNIVVICFNVETGKVAPSPRKGNGIPVFNLFCAQYSTVTLFLSD